MKNIDVVNFEGKQFSGAWNGKAYSSKIKGHEELHRIYVDNDLIHITSEELKRLQNDDAKRQKNIAINKINDFFEWIEEQPDEIKNRMFMQALDMMSENSKRSKTSKAIGELREYFYNF